MAISNPSGNYIDKITLPTGTEYTIVDAGARTEVDAMSTTIGSISSNLNSLSSTVDTMSKYTLYLGVTTSELIDNSTTNPVVSIGGTDVTATTGCIVISGTKEFIYDGSKWLMFGDLTAINGSLGSLAYKNSASSTYIKFVSTTSTSSTVSSGGSFTPSGTVSISSTTTAYVKINSTTTAPADTANYWVYLPAGAVSVTYWGVSTSSSFVNSLTITSPTTETVTDGVNYTSVSNHNLNLCYLVAPSAKAYTATSTIKSETCNFSGTTIYSERQSITMPETFSFTGTSGTVSVTSSAKFLDSVSSTTESVTITVS